MPKSAKPFLMFDGSAEEAMTFYAASIPDCRILNVERFDAAGPGPAGTIRGAIVSIAGMEVMFFDSFVKHDFAFTPRISFFITCANEAEFESIVARLGEGGGFLMPPDNYGYSRKFAWLNDRFGVSWQVNVE